MAERDGGREAEHDGESASARRRAEERRHERRRRRQLARDAASAREAARGRGRLGDGATERRSRSLTPAGARRRPHLDPDAAAVAITLDASLATRDLDPLTRFRRAISHDLHTEAPPAHAEALRMLAHAEIVGAGRIAYSSNATFLLELDAGDPFVVGEPLRAVYKPARGERPLWDFPRHTLHFREVASYLVDSALESGLIPPTTLRDGPYGPGSVQLLIHAARQPLSAQQEEEVAEQLHRLAALDVLINNADRKSAHLLVSRDARLFGIDNALTFLPYPRQRTVLLDLGGSVLPEPVTEAVQSLASDDGRRDALRRKLALLLAPVEVKAFEHRLRELAEDPVYPVLDDWDGRPFEWF